MLPFHRQFEVILLFLLPYHSFPPLLSRQTSSSPWVYIWYKKGMRGRRSIFSNSAERSKSLRKKRKRWYTTVSRGLFFSLQQSSANGQVMARLEVEFLTGSPLLEAAVTVTAATAAEAATVTTSPVAAEASATAAVATTEAAAVTAAPVVGEATIAAAEATTATASIATAEATTTTASIATAEAAAAATTTAESARAATITATEASTVTTAVATVAAATAAAATAPTSAHEQRSWGLGRSGHTPAELSETVSALEQAVLVAVPLEATEEAAERSVELVRVDLLVCLGGVLEDLANVLGNLGGLAHIDSGSLKLGCGIAEGQATETAADLVPLKGCDIQPALALLAGTTGTAETVDVGLAVTGETDLDYVGDVGKVHTASCDVGREEDARLAVAEVI